MHAIEKKKAKDFYECTILSYDSYGRKIVFD